MNWIINTAFAVDVNLPGTNIGTGTSGPGAIIANFYQFALIMSGILAFGAIVWGGIKYATGRGNPTAESEGKSWITNALLGLLLLAGAYIILYTINPRILNLQLPGLPRVAAPVPPAASAPPTAPAREGFGGGASGGGGAGGDWGPPGADNPCAGVTTCGGGPGFCVGSPGSSCPTGQTCTPTTERVCGGTPRVCGPKMACTRDTRL